jgi:hypothetical protein
MATRPRPPQDERAWQLDKRWRFWFEPPLEGTPLPNPAEMADLLDWHEQRLRNYRPKEKSERLHVRRQLQLVESSKKALQEGRDGELAVNLHWLAYNAGRDDGGEQTLESLRRDDAEFVRFLIPKVWKRAKHESSAQAARARSAQMRDVGDLGRDQRRENEAARDRGFVAEARAIRKQALKEKQPPPKRWAIAGQIQEGLKSGRAAGAKVISRKRIDEILARKFPS